MSNLPNVKSKHCRLEISGLDSHGRGDVYHFAFLEGGRYLIILHRNGTFTCWDMLQDSGVLLAEFVTGSNPVGWNFQTNPEKAEVLVVLTTMRRGGSKLDVLKLTFHSDEAIQLKITQLASTVAPFRCEKIFIHGDLVCSSGTTWPNSNVLLFVWDTISDLHTFLDTGINDSARHWESFACLPHGIMLYRDDGHHAYTFWYDDARKLLEEAKSPPYPGSKYNIIGRLRRPDGGQVHTFDEDCALSNEGRFYFVGHPWNTPNERNPRNGSVSIISFAQGVGPRPGATALEVELSDSGSYPFHRTITQHWFEPPPRVNMTLPEELSQLTTTDGELPVIRRWIHHIPFNALANNDEQSDMICIGSHGTHLLWLWDNIREILEWRQQDPRPLRFCMASLLPTNQATERGFPSEAAIRDISFELSEDMEIDLRRVTTMDMEDSHGIIGLVMKPEINGAPDGTDLVYIHLLYL
ncbi:hypothetical protein FRB95_008078 [Tulasnella sp. JGI-2019a]|nr:hypothetical protein FRB95_008078 [Tulasnella sp. JGI-2019a]